MRRSLWLAALAVLILSPDWPGWLEPLSGLFQPIGTAAAALELRAWPVALAASSALLLAVVLVRRRRAAVEHRREHAPGERLLGRLVAGIGDGVLTFGADGRIVSCNSAAAQLFGAAPVQICGGDVALLLRFEPPAELVGAARKCGVHELRARRCDGRELAVEAALSGTELAGRWLGVALLRDISARAARQAELERMALHDALTGLPNRTLLNDRIEHAIVAARRDGGCMALLLLDLDRFKDVNDTLGHQIGDRLLQQIGPRLRAPLRDADTVARLGGDEFAILLPAPTTLSTACRVAERVVEALSHPFVVDDLMLEVGVSIGVALHPGHAEGAPGLLHAADVAMYTAKRSQLGFVVYSAGSKTTQVRRLTLTGELRRAIEGHELGLDFQPKICARSGRVVGAEALVRWRHSCHGPIPPDAFIRSAEQAGLIKRLTLWVLNAALEQLQSLRRQGYALTMAVNLSGKSLQDPELPETLRFLLATWEVPAELLILELTENALIADPPAALGVLRRVSGLGCRLSLDDFGTGYSSLAFLQKLPIDELKIDRSFVAAMTEDPNAATIVRSVVRLAKALNLCVVAEGVESEAAFTCLRALGCDQVQGHYFGPAMAGQSLVQWLGDAPAFDASDEAPQASGTP